MKYTPTLFNEEMSKTRFNGLKTETRRIILPQPDSITGTKSGGFLAKKDNLGYYIKCPYGDKGDFIWVKEAYYAYGRWEKSGLTDTGKQAWRFVDLTKQFGFNYKYNNVLEMFKKTCLNPAYRVETLHWEKRNRLFMPRRAARFIDEIAGIHIERVQDITVQGAYNEGISYIIKQGEPDNFIDRFEQLWDSINKKRGYGWNKNPWVFVIKFKIKEKQ